MFDGSVVPADIGTKNHLGANYACNGSTETSPLVTMDFGSATGFNGMVYSQRAGSPTTDSVSRIDLWFGDTAFPLEVPAGAADESITVAQLSENLIRYNFSNAHTKRYVLARLIGVSDNPGGSELLLAQVDTLALFKPSTAFASSEYAPAYGVGKLFDGSVVHSDVGSTNHLGSDYASCNLTTMVTMDFGSSTVFDAMVYSQRAGSPTTDSVLGMRLWFGDTPFPLHTPDRAPDEYIVLTQEALTLIRYDFAASHTARYVLVVFNGRTDNPGGSELLMGPTASPLCKPATAFASSEYSSAYAVRKLFDGSVVLADIGTTNHLGADYAMLGNSGLAPLVTMNFGSSTVFDAMVYSQRAGSPTNDSVSSIDLWFDNTAFSLSIPGRTPDEHLTVTQVSETITRYNFASSHTSQYVLARFNGVNGNPGGSELLMGPSASPLNKPATAVASSEYSSAYAVGKLFDGTVVLSDIGTSNHLGANYACYGTAVPTPLVTMDFGMSAVFNAMVYSQRAGSMASDGVASIDLWFSNTAFPLTVPTYTPDESIGVFDLSQTLVGYDFASAHTARYVLARFNGVNGNPGGSELLLAAQASWSLGKPVVGYWAGPGYDGTVALTDTVANQMVDVGMNLVWAASATEVDLAGEHGLRAMYQNRTVLLPANIGTSALNNTVDELRNKPALYAYQLVDEPSATTFSGWGSLVSYLRYRDSSHAAHIDLLSSNCEPATLGADNYDAYLNQFVSTVNPSLICYDFYQYMTTYDEATYLQSLGKASQKAISAGVPFMNVIQACKPDTVFRVPNGDEERFLVYSNLAYGSQGIFWYVWYWAGLEGGIVDSNGDPTAVYNTVKALNAEFVAIAGQYRSLNRIGAYLKGYESGYLPPGTTILPGSPRFDITSVSNTLHYTSGDPLEGVLFGLFDTDGTAAADASFAVVVNNDYSNQKTYTIHGPGNLSVFDASTGVWTAKGSTDVAVTLPKGGGVLVGLTSLIPTGGFPVP